MAWVLYNLGREEHKFIEKFKHIKAFMKVMEQREICEFDQGKSTILKAIEISMPLKG